jgi:hypothetical protein
MSSKDHGQRQFFYDSPCLGSVQTVYPIDPNDRRFYVDVLPHDNRGAHFKVPVYCDAGGGRQLRRGMTVLIAYIDGNPQTPVVIGHNNNNEQQGTIFYDPLHPEHQNIDDYVEPHEETASYYRVRSYLSSPTKAAPAGSPVQVDRVFNSGLSWQIYEYQPPDPPPTPPGQPIPPPQPPQRAKITFTMPSGLTLVADEPEQGESDILVNHPSGAVIHVDYQGNITVESPAKILLQSDQVELGADNGMTLAFLQELADLTTWAQTHTHTGVQSGGGTSGPPMTDPPTPVGTQDTFAT